MRTRSQFLRCSVAMLLVTSARAQQWTPISPLILAGNLPTWRVAASADGNKVFTAGYVDIGDIAGFHAKIGTPIFISSDSGLTWTITSAPSLPWSSIACSADGTRIVASSLQFADDDGTTGAVYLSSDSGTSWTPASVPTNEWSHVACSADGSCILCVARGDYFSAVGDIVFSTNSGATWHEAQVPDPGPGIDWEFAEMSADGKTLSAYGQGWYTVVNCLSTNSGASWNAISARTLAISANGAKIFGTGQTPLVCSTNSGQTWTDLNVPGLLLVISFGASADGNFLMLSGGFDSGGNSIPENFISTNGGASWVLADGPLFDQLTCSADGTKLFGAGADYNKGVWTSTYGGPWQQKSSWQPYSYLPPLYGVSLAASADGRTLLEPDNSSTLLVSTDFGASWSSNILVASVACSSDGRTIVVMNTNGHPMISVDAGKIWFNLNNAASGERIVCSANASTIGVGPRYGYGASFISTNSGVSWYEVASNSFNFLSCSGDGTEIAAVDIDNSQVVVSSNAGRTWSFILPANGPINQLALSFDGRTIVGASTFGGDTIYVSTNSGASCITNLAPGPVTSISCSADGDWIVAAIQGRVMVSADFGATWQNTFSPEADWVFSVAPDGSAAIAGSYLGPLYYLNSPVPDSDPGFTHPTLHMNGNTSTRRISWIMPSSPFVLQENPDLTSANWTDMTNSPALNLTNLDNEISVALSPSNHFYRLKQAQ